jgi:hypothetical protein
MIFKFQKFSHILSYSELFSYMQFLATHELSEEKALVAPVMLIP